MVIACTQPAIDYYAWQVDIFLHSIGNLNIGYENVHVIFANDTQPSQACRDLVKKYPAVLFEFYDDTRDYRSYPPSVKQHLLYKHYQKHTWLEEESLFHVDCDVAFTKPINFDKLLKDDIWYLSNTISYIGYEYILSKGRPTLEKMLDIAEIDEETVKQNQNNSGGAQYLFKNVKTEFWKEVVDLSHSLFIQMTEYINQTTDKSNPDPYYPLQIWTAEMWAVLWTAWKKGTITKVVPELDFSWATDPIQKWDAYSIYHNAGVTSNDKDLFYKSNYMVSSPKDSNLEINPKKASYNYYQMLKKALW